MWIAEVSHWERRLSAGFARRGLDAPGARPAALEGQLPTIRRLMAARAPALVPASPDAADAASSRDGDEPAGKPALPVSREMARRPTL